MAPERTSERMRVAAVIVNYRTPHMVLRCLDALMLERELLPDLIATVVDNASGDESATLLSSVLAQPPYADWVSFIELPLNGGFGWGNNQAIIEVLQRQPPPDAVFLVNPDAIIQPGGLFTLVEDMQLRPDAGAIGSQLLDENGSLSGSAFRFPTVAMEFIRGLGLDAVGRLLGIVPVMVPYGHRGPIEWVTGASVLVRVQALRDAGMFDTGFFLYFEEVELMHRFARFGWKTYHCPESRVIHSAGASTGVVDGKVGHGQAPPPYIFRSRQRYFALTSGRMSALCADFAWLAGLAISIVLNLVTLRWKVPIAWEECKALIRIGLGAKSEDDQSAIAKIDDKLGEMPAWQKK